MGSGKRRGHRYDTPRVLVSRMFGFAYESHGWRLGLNGDVEYDIRPVKTQRKTPNWVNEKTVVDALVGKRVYDTLVEVESVDVTCDTRAATEPAEMARAA